MLVENNFKDRIYRAYEESEKFSQSSSKIYIVKGSDEHLDIISDNKPTLDSIIGEIEAINNAIEEHFPSSSVDEANAVKQALHTLHSSAKMILNKLKAVEFIAESFKGCLSNLEDEVLQIEEYIDDINTYVLSEERHIPDDLMDELNEL